MSVYDLNVLNDFTNLTPPSKRKPTTLAYLGVFAWKLQFLHDLFFNYYANGSIAPFWVSGNTYSFESKVVDIDNAVYSCTSSTGVTSTTNPKNDTANWIKILNTYIGVRERVAYTGQTAILEYALNRFFLVAVSLPFARANHINQIYIVNNAQPNNRFYLTRGNNAPNNSYLNRGGSYNNYYVVRNTYTFNLNAFTVYVPTALYSAIAANQPPGQVSPNDPSPTAAGSAIRAFLSKYVQCGFNFNILTY